VFGTLLGMGERVDGLSIAHLTEWMAPPPTSTAAAAAAQSQV
jgi:hypothetical protein